MPNCTGRFSHTRYIKSTLLRVLLNMTFTERLTNLFSASLFCSKIFLFTLFYQFSKFLKNSRAKVSIKNRSQLGKFCSRSISVKFKAPNIAIFILVFLALTLFHIWAVYLYIKGEQKKPHKTFSKNLCLKYRFGAENGS